MPSIFIRHSPGLVHRITPAVHIFNTGQELVPLVGKHLGQQCIQVMLNIHRAIFTDKIHHLVWIGQVIVQEPRPF